MSQIGNALPFDEDPDPTDRLPAIGDECAHEDPLEVTGTWAGPAARGADDDEAGGIPEQFAELQREHEALTAEYTEMRSTIARLENQLSESREVEEALQRQLDLERETRGRLEAALAGREPPAPAAAVQKYLARLDTDEATIVPLLPPRTRVGRTAENELQLHESYISRSHAVIKLSAREVIVEDLNSRNGVFVNGRPVTRELLKEGDIVTFGKARFRLQHFAPANT